MLTFVLCVVGLFAGIQAQHCDTKECPGLKDGQNDEGRLIKDLFKNYNRDARPVQAFSDKVEMTYGMSLITIDYFSDDSNDITVSVWEKMMWKDAFLKWDPSAYGGVEMIRIPTSYLWIPDVVLYNNLDVKIKRNEESLVVLTSDGTVLWIPQSQLRTRCAPGDQAKSFSCSLKFGSWTYDSSKVGLEFYDGTKDLDVADYTDNRRYELGSHSAEKHLKKYDCCEELYGDLTFYFTITKK